MGIINWYQNTKTALSKKNDVFNASTEGVSQAQNRPLVPNWFWQAKLGMPRNINIRELRSYAKSSWAQMVLNTIIKQAVNTEWRIVNSDSEDETDRSKEIAEGTDFLNNPNRQCHDFWEVWTPYLKDLLELDAGVVWKGRNSSGKLVELFSYDGSTFLIELDEYGVQKGYYQYSYKFPKGSPLFFENDEIVYGQMNLSNETRPYGFSPLQGIVQEVEFMIQSTRYNKEFFKNNAVPDGIVSVPMESTELERFKFAWKKEVMGKPHKLMFHNSEAKFTSLANTNKDMEWLEGQKWIFHIIFGAYGLSPQEVGFYENSNTDTQEGQERVSARNAIKPYLDNISKKLSREILPEFYGHSDLKFEFVLDNDQEEDVLHVQRMAKLNAGALTINEVRAFDGLKPVEWGDKPMNLLMQENISNAKEEDSEDYSKDKKDFPDEDSKKLYSKLLNKFVKDGKL